MFSGQSGTNAFGITAGGTCDLLTFDSSAGLASGDFSFNGVAGTFEMLDGRLAFTATAIPEPGPAWLWLPGLLVLCTAPRGRRLYGCHPIQPHRLLRSVRSPGAICPGPTA